jgi:hypothetical protein
MRLVITRSYETPSFRNKSPYRFAARLELSDEESKIISQYNLGNTVLTRSPASGITTLASLIRGYHEEQSDLDMLMRNEQTLRDSCESLPALFGYCRSFGEAVAFDYP